MTEHHGLPVYGYAPQGDQAVDIVNRNKLVEEEMLRILDLLGEMKSIDQRWLAIGRTHLEQGWMAVNRAVFRPQRVQEPLVPRRPSDYPPAAS